MKRLLYVVYLAVVMAATLEFFARCWVPHSVAYEGDTVATILRKASIPDYDVIAIGDSFVATGIVGWTRTLGQKGWKVLNLGVIGTGPSQYKQIFDQVAPRLTPRQKVVIVLYIGNDFSDQAIWDSLGTHTDQYFQKEAEIYGNPNSGVFWPFAHVETTPSRSMGVRIFLKRYFYTARLISGMKWGLIARLRKSREDEMMANFLKSQLNEQFAYKTANEVFFIKYHNATAREAGPALRQAADHILHMAKEWARYDQVYLIPVLSREEIGADLHHQPILRNAPFIDQLKAVNPRVIDVNPIFIKTFPTQNLYYVDGHWNAAGHELFAEEVEKHLLKGRP